MADIQVSVYFVAKISIGEYAHSILITTSLKQQVIMY